MSESNHDHINSVRGMIVRGQPGNLQSIEYFLFTVNLNILYMYIKSRAKKFHLTAYNVRSRSGPRPTEVDMLPPNTFSLHRSK